jgi:hypothetical protein
MKKGTLLFKKLALFVLAIMGMAFKLASQEFQTVEINPFTSIVVNGRIDVDLVLSKQEKLEIALEGIEREDLRITSENGTLEIKMVSTLTYKDKRAMARIHFSNLKQINSYSSANVSSEEMLVLDSVLLVASGGGEIALNLMADHIKSNTATGGVILLKGKTGFHQVLASSGGTLSAYELESEGYRVLAKSKSNVKINAGKDLEAKSTTGAHVLYTGNPGKKVLDTRFGGKIEPVEL